MDEECEEMASVWLPRPRFLHGGEEGCNCPNPGLSQGAGKETEYQMEQLYRWQGSKAMDRQRICQWAVPSKALLDGSFTVTIICGPAMIVLIMAT